jgi:hypothetical protein
MGMVGGIGMRNGMKKIVFDCRKGSAPNSIGGVQAASRS